MKIVLITNNFEEVHLGKDVFLVPYYISKKLGCPLEIAYTRTTTNADMPREYRECRLVPLPSHNGDYNSYYVLKYLLGNAKEISMLVMFHGKSQEVTFINLYKLLNPKGKVYVKMDCDPKAFDSQYRRSKWWPVEAYRIWKRKLFIKNIDQITAETNLAMEVIRQNKNYRHRYGNKLSFLPNGFDEELLQELNIMMRSFEKKENLFITVGRIGTTPKNSHMLLRALQRLNLKDWRFVFIGPVEEAFQEEINKFYDENPAKKDAVSFVGNILDKKELWDYYNKAKVFVLTSVWESYALVLVEALRFGDFLLSTDVGAFIDLSESGKYGIAVNQNDDMDLADKMQSIIDGKTNVEISDTGLAPRLSWENVINTYFKLHL